MEIDSNWHGSPSKIYRYLLCPQKYIYDEEYGAGPFGVWALSGKSVDEALSENFNNKLSSGKDLKVDDVRDHVATYFDHNKDQYIIEADDKPFELRERTIERTGEYHKAVSRSIMPRKVQQRTDIQLAPDVDEEGNVTFEYPPLVTYTDLRAERKKIIDWKVVSSANKFKAFNHTFQMCVYDLIEDDAELELHYMNLAKNPKENIAIKQVVANRRMVKKLYRKVLEGIMADIFIPNRLSHLCSPKYCSRHWERCHRENG